MNLLKAEDLWKSFGGLAATSGVNFAIDRAEILALIGPNGAGKTTLLNLITNHLTPDKGAIVFDGDNIVGLPRHNIVKLGIARTFQALTVFEALSVEDNIAIGQSPHMKLRIRDILPWSSGKQKKGARHEGFRAQIAEVAAFVNLDSSLLERKVEAVSMLDKKRVAIAAALASKPKLLLLDEPLAGLNQDEALELLDLIRKAKSAGKSILLIDHNLEAVMSVAERVMVLNFGELIEEGPPEQVINSQKVSEVYLGK